MVSGSNNTVSSVEIPLTRKQRDLLVRQLTVPPHLRSLFEDGFANADSFTVSLSVEDLQDIVSETEDAIRLATNEGTRRQLIDLSEHLLDFEPEHLREQLLFMADEASDDEEEARALFEGLAYGLETRMLSVSSVRRILDVLAAGETDFSPQDLFPELLEALGDEPMEDGGDLTPLQAITLATTPIGSDKSLLRINQKVDLDGSISSYFAFFSRHLLGVIHQAGKVKATKAGNLNRKFVSSFLQSLPSACPYPIVPGSPGSGVGEKDIFELHLARCLLEESGCIKLKKGAFHITEMGKNVITKESKGFLYAGLFLALCTSCNLSYFDNMPEIPSFQDTISYPLYRLSKEGVEWKTIGELADGLLFPGVSWEMDEADDLMRSQFLALRFFRFLLVFDLVEVKEPETKPIPATKLEVRKTPLFDLLIDSRFE